MVQDAQAEHVQRIRPAKLGEVAYYGLAGDFVREVAPITEADQVGILLQYLLMFGNIVGIKPHFMVNSTPHHMNEYGVLTGPTGVGAKGTGLDMVKDVFSVVDSGWAQRSVASLSSGEGLVFRVRDEVWKRKQSRRKKKQPEAEPFGTVPEEEFDIGDFTDELIDKGVADKRLMVLAPEFGSVLTVMGRTGNSLGHMLTQLWDGHAVLETVTRQNPLRATNPHISVITHITLHELVRRLDADAQANGFANRFLYVDVELAHLLPNPPSLDPAWRDQHGAALAERVAVARDRTRLHRTRAAEVQWERVYPDLRRISPLLRDQILGRGASHVMRLACLYALLDGVDAVDEPHLHAALELWRYAAETIRLAFTTTTGNKDADHFYTVLCETVEPGRWISRTGLRDVLGHHFDGPRLSHGLRVLAEHGLAESKKARSPGASKLTEFWRPLGYKSTPPSAGRNESKRPDDGVYSTPRNGVNARRTVNAGDP